MGCVNGATYCVVVVGGNVVVVVEVVEVVDVVVVDVVVVVVVEVGAGAGAVVDVVAGAVVVTGAVLVEVVAVDDGACAASSGDPHVANNSAPAATVSAIPGTANRHCPLTGMLSS